MKINYELLALAALLRNSDQTLFLGLSPELFTGQYSALFKLVSKEFSNSHKIPTLSMLNAIIAERAPRDLRPTLNAILSTMDSVDILGISPDQILSGLKDKHLLLTVDNSIQELNNFAMLRDTQGVRGVLNKIVEDINLDSVRPMDITLAMEAEDKSRIIPTCIDGIDEHLGGGFTGFSVISGSSGGGKSIFLGQCAVGQYLKGYNVLFVSLELSAQTMGNRIKSYLTGIPFGKINRDKGVALDDTERTLIKTTMSEFANRENVFRIVSDPLDTDELLNLIKIESNLYNIDVVYIDYLNLVQTPKGASSGWHNLQETCKSLHRISQQLGTVVVSASQVNTLTKPKAGGWPSIEPRGSKEIEYSASVWMHLYSPESDDTDSNNDSVVGYVMKTRIAEKTQLLFEKRFATMHVDFTMQL